MVEQPPQDWCLFLDRDGVLNEQVHDDYVRSWEQFSWLPGALDALVTLSRWAPYVVVVTNQQGVGRGLMSAGDLQHIHEHMHEDVNFAGGRLDAVLHCPHLASWGCRCRKPQPGLARDWLEDRPWIDPEKCVMVGDSWSDIAMGRHLTNGKGTCVLISPSEAPVSTPSPDARFESLHAFVESLELGDLERMSA